MGARALVLLALSGCFTPGAYLHYTWNFIVSHGPACPRDGTEPQPRTGVPRILYVTQSAGWRHDSIEASVHALRAIGREVGFDVACSDDARASIKPDLLAQYRAVAFFTSGDLGLTLQQKGALLEYVRAGGGFVALHSGIATYEGGSWLEYGELVGARFDGHPWNETIGARVEDPQHPAVRDVPRAFELPDEVYQVKDFVSEGTRVLLALDRESVTLPWPGAEERAWGFPLAWARSYGRGRVFYSGLGHYAAGWSDARHLKLVRNGIVWAMGEGP